MEKHFNLIDWIEKRIDRIRTRSKQVDKSKELFDAIRKGFYLTDTAREGYEPVYLNVYDLSPFTRVASNISGTSIFHTGVEVFGKEYTFAASSVPGTGIRVDTPRTDGDQVKLRKCMLIGHTALNPQQVEKLIDEMKQHYVTSSYHLLRRNCCTFSAELTEILCRKKIPSFITKTSRRISRMWMVRYIPDKWCRL